MGHDAKVVPITKLRYKLALQVLHASDWVGEGRCMVCRVKWPCPFYESLDHTYLGMSDKRKKNH